MLVPARAFRRPWVNRSRALGQAAAQLMLIFCGDDIPEQRAQLTAKNARFFAQPARLATRPALARFRETPATPRLAAAS
jgi:hypothetical protein